MAIAPQLQAYSQELVEERRLPFEVLSDRGNAVAGDVSSGLIVSLRCGACPIVLITKLH